MVDFLHRCQAASRFAVLAERVLGDVDRTDLPPLMPVAFVDLRVALKLAVPDVGFTLVGFAVRAVG